MSHKPQIDDLRAAIQSNRVSFPMPVPIFPYQYRAEVQWRLAELYFVHSWSPDKLGARYNISANRVRQSLRAWVGRAMVLGYLQPVPEEETAAWTSTAPLMQAAAR